MSVPRFDPAGHARMMRARGFWPDRTIDEYLARAIAATPDRAALVAYRADSDSPRRLTYRDLGDAVARAAAGLRSLGTQHGDVVAVQLPNWVEFVVTALAANRIGAVVNPLMPIFRERELEYMLGFAGARVLVVPRVFRGFEHAAMGRTLQRKCTSLSRVVVVDDDGPDGFESLLLGGTARIEPAQRSEQTALRPDDVAVLMFTSGTTGSPKGVMHPSNTLLACANALSARFGLGSDEVLLGCSPLAHMVGYAAILVLGLRVGATIVLQDVWDARRGVNVMAAEGATYTAGSTPFLADICDAVAAGAPRPPRLRSFLCAGAPIPPVLIERADREMGLKVCSLWGMTESLASTMTEPERAAEKSMKTDGRPLDGVEVRVVGPDGQPLPNGATGRLLVRGAHMFVGYYKRPDIETFDPEGWFDTGDLAYMDDEGYIRINGRTKDVLIRGGENVPVVEIEALLYRHPAVAEAAVVGYPDERLGERGCACVVLRSGRQLDLEALRAYMAECKVARQYWPERLEIFDTLPRTPSGKIQKFRLREAITGSAASSA